MSSVTSGGVKTSGLDAKPAAPAWISAGGELAWQLYGLCHPRITMISVIAAVCGYVLASETPFTLDMRALVPVLAGIGLLVTASSAVNQVLEASTDRRMERTASRPVAAGNLAPPVGAVFGACCAIIGTLLLWSGSSAVAAGAGLVTFLIYAFLYTPLKTRSVLCTTVGAVPGAMPAVLGWFAAGGPADVRALSLFAVFFVWQYPHFLAIGWMYRHQYASAGLRMLPSYTDGGRLTRWVSISYAVAFLPVVQLPAIVGVAGDGYQLAASVLAAIYLVFTFRFFRDMSRQRARTLVLVSLAVITGLLMAMVSDYLFRMA